MKRILTALVLALLCVSCMFTAFACDGGSDLDGEKGIICKKLTGEDFYTVYDYVPENDETTVLDIDQAVKAKYGIDAVVGRINANTFAGDDTLLEIIVPASVTEIRAGAFDKIRSLQKITLPFVGRTANGDSFIGETGDAPDKSIDDEKTFAYIFGTEEYAYGAKITVNYGASETKDFYIPSSLSVVTIAPKDAGYKIPAYAFNGTNQISEVKLTANVAVIGINAFENAKSLSKINLPSSITTIRENAFKGASNLKDLIIEAIDMEIEVGAFKGCEKLDVEIVKNSYVDKDVDKDIFD